MKKFKFNSTLNIMLGVVLLLVLVSFIGVKFYSFSNENIVINIDDKNGNYFVSTEDVEKIIEDLKVKHPTSNRLKSIDLKTIENALKSIDFVLDAQVSRDLKGNIIIDIEQHKPIARIMTDNGEGAYINESNQLLDLSDNYAARVMLVTGSGADSLMSNEFLNSYYGKKICKFIKHLNYDEFWKAQVAQLDFDEELEIKLYPQVGIQVFEFGSAENYEAKLNKMEIFYNEIVPKKGWGEYKLVKLQYNGQIVCR